MYPTSTREVGAHIAKPQGTHKAQKLLQNLLQKPVSLTKVDFTEHK